MNLANIKCLKNSPPQRGLVSFELTNHQPNLHLVKFLELEKSSCAQLLILTVSMSVFIT
jgi:hypothetical protein